MPIFSGLNYVNVGPRGHFTPSGAIRTTPDDIDAIFSHLATHQINKLVIHFHGGLVRESAGLEVARKLTPVYTRAESHPVTFIWETGLLETLSRNLTRLHETRLFTNLLTYVVRHVAKRLGGGIGAKGPGEVMSDEEILAELLRDDAFDRFDAGARGGARGIRVEDLPLIQDEIEAEVALEMEADATLVDLLDSGMAETEYLKPDVMGAPSTGAAKGIVSTARLVKAVAVVSFQVLRRFVRGTDHGLYPTVVEEILRELYLADFGAWVWGGMKQVAQDMWLPNGAAITQDSHVGTYFLEKLSAYQQAHPGFIVDLVGHSAGAIAICEMFKAGVRSQLPLTARWLIFLAPACRTDLFLEEVVMRPERFAHFRMFTMKDALETQDRLVPGIYTRSLLYFIAGALEDEPGVGIAGLHRQSSGQAPYDEGMYRQVRTWLDQGHRRVLSSTGQVPPGLISHAARHGDFDDDEATRDSLVALIS
ncbi:hypothetical protein [Ectothiorhodospira lacustris]|uniref:hypothetical protein n=1 Tax=Ectothiorhodospira lacustris TaxID=2899127 RepID=UPI001EE7C447|nr:hypothetical protein [Ectothiorhodospira lacustris]MCG5501532.1 hypothetical protein [Ectothiorhodospira lacustris]MCG5509324.1 hypothetical protein [Ectothiorhodospira lacustris]MCG5521378.1 hypothetical protein [Ectothiorhodospira lacustris]